MLSKERKNFGRTKQLSPVKNLGGKIRRRWGWFIPVGLGSGVEISCNQASSHIWGRRLGLSRGWLETEIQLPQKLRVQKRVWGSHAGNQCQDDLVSSPHGNLDIEVFWSNDSKKKENKRIVIGKRRKDMLSYFIYSRATFNMKFI